MRKVMTIHITCSLFALILIQGCNVGEPNINRVDLHPSAEQALMLQGISKDAAITRANEDALKEYKSLTGFRIIACEQSIFWRVIYDGGGPEYVIDKVSGRIIKKQKLPQGSNESKVATGSDLRAKQVGREEAIAIARNDAFETYGNKIDIDQFVIRACEQSNVWRVVFDYQLQPGESLQDLPNANFPKYVIDKTTSKILYREFN
jgi:hypothetical protein